MSKKYLRAFFVTALGVATTASSFFGFSMYDQGHANEAEAISKSWQQVNTDGFGASNTGMSELVSAGGELFAIAKLPDPVGPEIWKHSYTGATDSWTKVLGSTDACANPVAKPDNEAFTEAVEYNGKLILSSNNPTDGSFVYQVDPATLATGTCNDTAITGGGNRISDAGLGLGATFTETNDVFVLDGSLYAVIQNTGGTANAIMKWTDNTTTWTQMNTTIPTGFGAAGELSPGCDVVTSSKTAYCGVTDGSGTVARMYKSTDLNNWTKIGTDDFGNANNLSAPFVGTIDSKVYFAVSNATDGVEAYMYDDTTTLLTKIADKGFDAVIGADNFIAAEVGELNGMPYFSILNPVSGGRIYRYNKSSTMEVVSMPGLGDPANNKYPLEIVTHSPNAKSSNIYMGIPKDDISDGASRVYRFVDYSSPRLKTSLVGNGLDTNISFTLEDDETGIDISSVVPVITGSVSGVHTYSASNTLAAAPNTNSRTWTFTLNPDQDFASAETVTVSMTPCDRYVSQNCDVLNFQFQVLQQATTSINGGNGIVNTTTGTDAKNGIVNTTTGTISITGATLVSNGTNGYTTGSIYTEGVGVTGPTGLNGKATSTTGSKVCTVPQTPFVVTGAGKTGSPHVRVFDKNEKETANFFAFSRSLKSGIRVSTADVDADGEDEIIVGSGEGAAPHVRVFERDGTLKPIDFRPFHPNSRTGVDVSGGDIDGDGKDEIIMSQFMNGETWVKVYRYNASRDVIGQWVAYERGQEFGATVAAGDIDDDGMDEIITSPGAPGDPHVRVFEADGTFKGQIYAFPAYGFPETRRGMDVTVGDVNNDGKMEIGTSVLGQTQSWTKVYRWNEENHVVSEIKPYASKWNGTNVTMGDLDGDCDAEIITGAAFGGGPHIRGFQHNEHPMTFDFFAYDKGFRGGADVEYGSY